jgi:hypothetical protein
MEFQGFDRTRKLIHEIREALPAFAEMCSSRDTKFVVMHQDAFAPKLNWPTDR